jgi:outer membrane protein assembly factor BamB
MLQRCWILCVIASAATATVLAEDWPQWQGPERTAVSRETGLLKSWPKNGPRLLWRAEGLGAGYSTPSVAAGRVYTMGNRGRTEFVFGLDEATGQEVWSSPVGPVRAGGGGYPGPRCTPTVDGDRVYALGLNGDLVCLDTAGGQLQWRKDLRKDFGGSVGGWGYSESPLVDGDRVLCTPGGRTATLAALHKTTGETIWQAAVPGGDEAAYSSIIAADVAGQRQYVQFLDGGVVGVAAVDGSFLWRYDKPANGTANCSTPIFHDNCVFAASGYGTGGGLVRLTRRGERTEAKEVYFTRRMQNHHGGMVLVNGYLYGANEGELVCLDFKTGKVLWGERRPGKGSITCADGRLYYRNERGPVVLVEVNPSRYVERGRFEPPQPSGQPAWAHPVIANGKLLIADQDQLLCYDVKQ